tara:strand:- start:940 stop:1341 length:402 start_codon:yes stop_codon:yes gene_type:complete
MKKTNIILLNIVIFLFIILVISLLFQIINPYTIKKVPIFLEVGSTVGIDVNTTAITFSVVRPGARAERTLVFRSNVTETITLYVKDIPFVSVANEEFIVRPNETVINVIIAAPPKNTPSGNYTGTLLIVSKEQ